MPMSDRSAERLVAGLLGPADPEVTCERCFELLDVYVEHELAGDNADLLVAGMREHLQGCPACAEEHATLLELVGTLRASHKFRREGRTR
jgi:hypothetical protein